MPKIEDFEEFPLRREPILEKRKEHDRAI